MKGEGDPRDWEEWQTWELARRNAHTEASMGLMNGNLQPLAEYIRAGWPVDALLAEQIADAIEGPDDEGYTLRMSNRRGHVPFDVRDERHKRTMDIGLYVHSHQSHYGPGSYEGVIAAAMEKFTCARSTVTDAVAKFYAEMGWDGPDQSE